MFVLFWRKFYIIWEFSQSQLGKLYFVCWSNTRKLGGVNQDQTTTYGFIKFETKPNHENLGTKPNWGRKTQFDSVWNHSFYELWHHSQHNHNLHKDQAIIVILQTKLFKRLLRSSSHTCRQRINNSMSRNRILTNIFFAPPLQKSFSRG